VNYIQSLTNETILYGVTCDDALQSLSDDVRAVLVAIGVNVTGLIYRGKLTFVAVIGRPQATVLSVARNGSQNLVMNAILTRSYENFTGKHCQVDYL